MSITRRAHPRGLSSFCRQTSLRQVLLVLTGLVLLEVGGRGHAATASQTYNLSGGPGGSTFIASGLGGGSGIAWLPEGSLPAGSILKSVSINASLQAGSSIDSYVSDLCVYVDPTPETIGDDGLLQVGGLDSQVFGTVSAGVDWTGGDVSTIGVPLVDTKTAGVDFPTGIDLGSASVYLGNCWSDSYWAGTVTVTYDQVGPADMTSFELPGATTVISGTSITVTVPLGTVVSALAPTYTVATGATCNKASGSTQNFSSPVTYSVTAADNSVTKNYVVTVVVQQGLLAKTFDTTYGSTYLNPVANLTALTPTGTTNQTSNIDYNANFTTAFPSLTSTTTFSMLWEGWFDSTKGGSGDYTFGTNSDDGSVIYMDLNNDGDFADSGELVVNNNGDHTAASVTGTVNLSTSLGWVHTVIGYYQNSSTSVMTARFKKGTGVAYSSLDPVNGTAGYFSPGVPVLGPSSVNMLTFGLPDNRASIIGTNITLTVPYGTTVTNLAPTYTVSPLGFGDATYASGTARNFTTPQTYTIYSQNGTPKTYTVTVVVTAASTANDILTFGPGAVISGTDITWTFPFGTNVTNLAPVYTVSPLASEDASYPSGTPRNFSTPKTYTIRAQSGATKTYTVTVVVLPGDSSKEMLTFGPGATISGTSISWTISYAASLQTVAPTYTISPLATCSPASGAVITNLAVPHVYRVTAQDGSYRDYTLTITVTPPSTAKDMLTFGPGAVISGQNITWTLPYGNNRASLAPTYTISPLATCSPASGTTRNFTTPQTYTVTAEDGSTQVYTATVVITDSLVVHLPFDGNYTETVNGNTLDTLVGTPTFVTGKIGQAVKLTNTQSASRATTTGLPTGSGEFSWSAWVIIDTTHSSVADFVCWGPAVANQICAGGVSASTLFIRNNHFSPGNTQTFTYQPTVASANFTHLALVYQNSSGVREERLYVNGVYNSSATLTGAALDLKNSNLVIGGRAGNAERINARVDDVGIWNAMLPAKRIAAIHGLGHFSGVALDDISIALALSLTTPGQTITNVGSSQHTWTYVNSLSGTTGTTGGTVAGGNAYIVLDGSTGTGLLWTPADAYGSWASAKGLTGSNNGKSQDPDNDGVSNLGEFAFNGLPTVASSRGWFFNELKDNADAGSDKELTFTCAVRRSSTNFAADANNAQTATIDGVTYFIEASTSLTGTWNVPVSYVGKSDTAPTGSGWPSLAGTDWEYRTFSTRNGIPDKGFIRGRVTAP